MSVLRRLSMVTENHQELLRYRPAEIATVDFDVYDNNLPASQQWIQLGDVSYQAITRGGREVDAILEGKAQFKDSVDEVGDVSLASGVNLLQLGAQTQNRDLGSLGLVGVFGGLIAKGFANASKPKADTRAWDTLPSSVYWYGQSTPFSQKLTIMSDGDGNKTTLVATCWNR